MRYIAGQVVALSAIWLLWSGHYTALLLTFGVLSIVLVLAISLRMRIVDEEGAPAHIALRFLLYLPWLVAQIVKSNLDVARRILQPRMPIEPHVTRVRAGQRTDLGRVIYANSITLTPGTVTVDTEGDEILIHALTPESAEGVRSGDMDYRVSRLEGGA